MIKKKENVFNSDVIQNVIVAIFREKKNKQIHYELKFININISFYQILKFILESKNFKYLRKFCIKSFCSDLQGQEYLKIQLGAGYRQFD